MHVTPHSQEVFCSFPTPGLLLSVHPPGFNIISANDAVLSALNVSDEDLIGKDLFDGLNLEDDPTLNISELRGFVENTISGEPTRPTCLSNFKISVSGTYRYFNIKSVLLTDERSDATQVLLSLEEVTLSKEISEEGLQLSQERLKVAQEIAQFGIWDFSFCTGLQTFSEGACRIYDLPPDKTSLTPDEWLSFIHPEDLIRVTAEIEASIKNFRESTYNHRIILSDGSVKYIFAKAKFEFDSHKTPTGVFGVVQDVTELRKIEQHLEQQNRELTKTNKELDRFVYSTSHDLRSPLTSIMGLISLVQQDCREPETLEIVGMIGANVNRLDRFIRNILKYSRNNRTELEVEQISLKENINEVVNSLRHMKEAKGIQFNVDIVEQVPFFSDPQRLSTILENLVSNAIKYHSVERKNPFINITALSDHSRLHLTVSDNGTGIAPRYHHKIFDMFYRLSSESEGSGIGLYIVKDILERMEGTIKVSSEEGCGTTFEISIKNWKRSHVN